MSARKSSHGTIFLIVSNGSPLALIASSLRSTSKKPVCPMTRSLHPPMAHCGQRVRFVATWREEFFKVPFIHFFNVINVNTERFARICCKPGAIQDVLYPHHIFKRCCCNFDRCPGLISLSPRLSGFHATLLFW